jgi:hypothetical protein
MSQVSAFPCTHLSTIWEPEFPSGCINISAFTICTCISHIIVTLVLIRSSILPIWHLQRQRTKVYSCFIFVIAAGLPTLPVTILRLCAAAKAVSLDSGPSANMFVNLEVNICIICACFPEILKLCGVGSLIDKSNACIAAVPAKADSNKGSCASSSECLVGNC